jgi:hypothetical protein
MPADESDEDKDMMGLIDGDTRVAACVLQVSVSTAGRESYKGGGRRRAVRTGNSSRQTMGRSLYIAKLTRLG